MTKKEMIIEAIESFGYKPVVDDDGDIYVRYQMKKSILWQDRRTNHM